ncbi:MAG: peptidylprolyl isomerase [Hydrogenibacillus schlegelii]|uniref:Peptidylprolyl isomerase n=1 Tax=Hydrogenibacillus schlegelii TaxID=1484 RepID=A0A947GH54_HYDSH|nr:peptidylprolyl isomerase [Hydrogenibacillus schlegelii]
MKNTSADRVRRFGAGIVALFLVVALGACGGKGSAPQSEGPAQEEAAPGVKRIELAEAPDAVVARYDGGVVTAGDFQEYLNFRQLFDPLSADQTFWGTLLDEYVGLTLLAERADAGGVVPTSGPEAPKEAAQSFIRSLKDHLGEKGYADELKALGLTEAAIERYIGLFAKADAYLAHEAGRTDLKARYEAQKDDYTLTTVRHILIRVGEGRSDAEARKLAAELAERARKGEDFAGLADRYSEDPGNTNPDGSKNGGLYADVPAGQWVEPFKRAVLSQPIGAVGDPVKTDYGYHVIRVEKRTPQPFEAVKEELAARAAQEAYRHFMDEELKQVLKERHVPTPKAS